jgi:hypothetical protein
MFQGLHIYNNSADRDTFTDNHNVVSKIAEFLSSFANS